MDEFLLILAALVTGSLSLGIAWVELLSPFPAIVSVPSGEPGYTAGRRLTAAAVLLDGAAIVALLGLIALLWRSRPDMWFSLTAAVFFVGAVLIKLLWPGRNSTSLGSRNSLEAAASRASLAPWPKRAAICGAKLVGFISLAAFAILTRPPCPPAS